MRLPLVLELHGRHVACVGAGPIAAGKVVPMLECGAVVTVIAPEVDAGLLRADRVERRPYRDGDLAALDPRPRLVVAGTGVAQVDDAVAAEAAELGVWCVRIDGRGDAVVPSVIRRGTALVAVVTGAPALTRRLRQVLAAALDDRWATASTLLSGLRADDRVRAALAAVPPSVRRRRWRDAVDAVLADDVLAGGGLDGATGGGGADAGAARAAAERILTGEG